ncbi:uncharacterized protein LOC125232064 [Leguminivora glycinivorella]|uniref:uncharacterized protein LOC125232064 n=1 Tax=Leguminivora glycinivorella TaxID=1035111 RepID=UPI00200DFAF8|nr:uncharacterized protein LOC125232064 [Leguminivora glycinivorella]
MATHSPASKQLLSPESTNDLTVNMDISTTNDSMASHIESSFVDSEIDATYENSFQSPLQIQSSFMDSELDATDAKGSQGHSDVEFDLTVDEDMTRPETPVNIEGRRLVKMQYFMDQIIEISRHSSKFGCQLDFIQIIKERKTGLRSTFSLRCNMCNGVFALHTDDTDPNTNDVNHSAVSAAILMGCGSSNLKEFTASLDLPTVNQKIYDQCHKHLHSWWKEAAEKSMTDAALQETQEADRKSPSGKPMIAVTADACWAKRSYRNNYSSLSGVGAIIGINSGKVLHVGIKNKYCVTCARASSKNTTPSVHQCTINHKGSSTSMEQAAIVEGFKESVQKHGLIYSQLIADGDASTYKNIVDNRPYPGINVEKIECSNHLLRNYNGKNINFAKDTSIPLPQRKLLKAADRINRLRIAIKQAVRFRMAQNLSFADRVKELRKDILNSPSHVFGDHSACDDYYCPAEKKQEHNYVPQIPELMKKLRDNTTHLANFSQSLLYRLNNNRAEQFNSLVAKYVGGKRINYALKNSYTLRCYAAVVAFNTGMPIYALHKTVTGRSPSKASKLVEQRKRVNNSRKKVWKPKRIIASKDMAADYGEACQKPDMSPEEYERRKEEYLASVKAQLKERDVIERETILQSESALWLEMRRCILTASNFSKICKRRNNISPAPLVKTMLYGYSLDHVAAVQHGKNHEANAIKQLEMELNIKVEKCGLHIDPEHYFLGATPDGLYSDGIIEIKCPKSAFGMDPEEAIKEKKIKMWKVVNGVMVLNKNHDWFYQVQGQLHITNKDRCLFGVWTDPKYPLKIEIIEKDDNFWKAKMETRLINFYEKCLLPEIVDPRKIRSMPLRDDPF